MKVMNHKTGKVEVKLLPLILVKKNCVELTFRKSIRSPAPSYNRERHGFFQAILHDGSCNISDTCWFNRHLHSVWRVLYQRQQRRRLLLGFFSFHMLLSFCSCQKSRPYLTNFIGSECASWYISMRFISTNTYVALLKC